MTGQTNAERAGRPDADRLMRRRKIVAWVVTLIVVCAVTTFSSGNRTGGYGVGSVPSAVRSATTPLSSYENGLVDTPDPIDSSSDRVVTGNVTGGKHFRGALPYRPPTSIDAPLGSTSLDPFLRRTAPATTGDGYLGTSGSFYSPTGTVTSPGAGTAGMGQTSSSRYASGSDLRLPPGDATSAEIPLVSPTIPMGDLATGGPTSAQSVVVTREDYQQQMEQLQEKLVQVKAELAQLERSIATGAEAARPETRTVPTDSPALPDSVMQAAQPVAPSEASRRRELLQETARLLSATMGLSDGSAADGAALGQVDAGAASDTTASAQPRLRLYEEQEHEQVASNAPLSIDALVAPRTRRTAGAAASPSANELPAVQRINETARAFDTTSTILNRPQTAVPSPEASPGAQLPSGYRILGQTSDSAMSPIKAATTTTPTPASPPNGDSSSAKMFERYLQSGRQLMQQGQFQQAADAFTLASAYRPNDARAPLGKGHALLAAGQYLDSALFVAKAVEMDLPAVLQRTDLIQTVGGPEAFVAHFNELDQLIQADRGPQLKFLMAYIYYQMERPAEAKAAIDAAQKQLPTSVPIDLLRTAICR